MLCVVQSDCLSCLNVGNKIAVIENLGATLVGECRILYKFTLQILCSPRVIYYRLLLFMFQDQFDTIDLSDNEIRKLDGFPLLRRLKSLIISNNRVW